MPAIAKMQHCDYCGAEIGVFVKQWREVLSCGERECDRHVRDIEQQEREEAHEQLDRERGW